MFRVLVRSLGSDIIYYYSGLGKHLGSTEFACTGHSIDNIGMHMLPTSHGTRTLKKWDFHTKNRDSSRDSKLTKMTIIKLFTTVALQWNCTKVVVLIFRKKIPYHMPVISFGLSGSDRLSVSL